MKTSALTVGALTLLSQGIALASGESGSGSQCTAPCKDPQQLNNSAGYKYFYYNVGISRRKFTKVECYCSNGHKLGVFKEEDSLVNGGEAEHLIMEHDQTGETMPYHPTNHHQ